MSRLHDHLLGYSVPGSATHTEELTCSHQVLLQPTVTQALSSRLYGNRHWQGGPLFGCVANNKLELHFAAANGGAWWDIPRSPLAFDARYALGWSDALCAAYDSPVDWVGSWVMRADRQPVGLVEALSWIRTPSGGLFDDSRVLLCAGEDSGRLSTSAYRWSWLGEFEQLEVMQLP